MIEADMPLGEVLKEHRREHGLSLRAFSQVAGISHSEVLRIEKGLRTAPSLHTLIQLADAMKRPLEELLSLIKDGE
jgi:transcriptional regulator with XRE-family HTH domain